MNPDPVQLAHLMLRAMSEVWLSSAAVLLVAVAAQRGVVPPLAVTACDMLVSAVASVKQIQQQQQQQQEAATDSTVRR
jgi:hypothetical protein